MAKANWHKLIFSHFDMLPGPKAKDGRTRPNSLVSDHYNISGSSPITICQQDLYAYLRIIHQYIIVSSSFGSAATAAQPAISERAYCYKSGSQYYGTQMVSQVSNCLIPYYEWFCKRKVKKTLQTNSVLPIRQGAASAMLGQFLKGIGLPLQALRCFSKMC